MFDEMDKKTFRNILDCESAISEIIGALLLLAIAVGVIALIQTQSVPEWNKAAEVDHFNVVYNDFLKLKSDIEDVALFQFPKSSVIHMGIHYPDRMIFLNPADTSGTLTSRNDTWINVSFTPYNGTATSINVSATSITFYPNYNYYPNAPSLVYEHDLIIKNFTMDNYLYTDSVQTIFSANTINIMNLDFSEDTESFSGTKVLNYFPQPVNSTMNNTNVTVTLYTNYPLLWIEILNKYNYNYNLSGNILSVIYPGNITINVYSVNGSIASGTGASVIPATPAPTSTATPTEFTYVSNIFDILNITGNVTNFPAARNASDGGASSAFYENTTPADSYNYTYVTSNIATSGTIVNFSNMLYGSDSSDYATLSEGAVVLSDIPVSPSKVITNGTQSGSYYATRLNNNDGSRDVTIPETFDRGQTNKWTFDSNQESWVTSSCCKTGSGTVTMTFESDSGSPDHGSIEAKIESSGSATTATTFWNSTNFSWTNGTPDAVSFTFKWRVVDIGSASGSYWVNLIKPDGSVKTIDTVSTFSETDDWSSKSADALVPGDFSQNGYYRISLVARLATSSSEERKTTVRWDTPNLILTMNRYSTDATYSYTETNSSSAWVNITISDSSYAAAGTDIFIYNQTSSVWESIRTTNFENGTTDSPHVNSKVIPNPSNYDTGGGVIKIKYEGIELINNNNNIGIDILQPKIYYNNYNMNISTTTSSITGAAPYILETRYMRGNTNEAGYNMDIWNYTSFSWGSTQSFTSLSWTQNNVTLTLGQISGGQVKTRFTDQTPTGTSQGNLYIDFQRINGTLPGKPPEYHLDVTTNTTDIPQSNNHDLQIRYNVSGDNFMLQLWNGTSWNNRTILNETLLSDRTIPLLSNELIPDGDAGYYSLVRYVDLNATQQGTLYLDYQRIYNR